MSLTMILKVASLEISSFDEVERLKGVNFHINEGSTNFHSDKEFVADGNKFHMHIKGIVNIYSLRSQ